MIRRVASVAAIVLGALVLLAGTLAIYVKRNVLDADRFAERVVSALDDDTVRAELAAIAVAELERQVSSDLIAAQAAIEPALAELAGTPAFAAGITAALALANEIAFDRGAERYAVVVQDFGDELRARLDTVAPGLASRIPDGLDVRIADLGEAPALVDAAQEADRVRALSLLLPILGLSFLAAGVGVARDRRTAAFGAGLAVLAVGTVVVAGYAIAHGAVTGLPAEERGREAVGVLWSAVLGDLRDWGFGLAAVGAFTALGAALVLRRGKIVIATAAGLATAGAIAAFVVLGDDDPPPPEPRFAGECNGSVELCDRPFDRVAFATAHNAMSAGGYPGYLFPMQERPISEQLQAGIRGLMLDVYYGVPGRRVFTDFSRSPSKLLEKGREQFGPRFEAAADRVRDKISRPDDAQPELFLCHGFCELGAVPLADGLAEIKGFLEGDPGAVLALIFEDYAEPADMAAAIEASGLAEHVYEGSVEGWPTLGEMARTDQRVLVMAENRIDGAPAWYHAAYELMQETGYSFASPAEMARDCAPNRGEAGNPLFLINNWINTDPAARPSNARVVNKRRFLLDRAERCERERDALVNFLAIDFYGEGDVVGAVEALNAQR